MSERSGLERQILDEMLVLGNDDWGSDWVLRGVVQQIAGPLDRDHQRELALRVLGIALDEGWMRIGMVKGGFQPWNLSTEAALERVGEAWKQYQNVRDMMGDFWLENTPKGRARAAGLLKASKTIEDAGPTGLRIWKTGGFYEATAIRRNELWDSPKPMTRAALETALRARNWESAAIRNALDGAQS